MARKRSRLHADDGREQLSIDFEAAPPPDRNGSGRPRSRDGRPAGAPTAALDQHGDEDSDEPQQLRMFVFTPNIDVHVISRIEAVAEFTGPEPEMTAMWLTEIVGSLRPLGARRMAFPTRTLDRLAWIRDPAKVTLDASALAVARALWAHRLGLKPLRVTRKGRRLIASSPRWPTGLGIKDAPWPAIATITHLGVPLDVEPAARTLMTRKLAGSGGHIAAAGLAGSAVLLDAANPELLEALELPALAYAGGPGTGRYTMPLLAAERLLHEKSVRTSPELEQAIRRATAPVEPLKTKDSFPWTLYPFQARDAGRAARIVETTGGVLLAGDMGSGKTTIALALIDQLDVWPLLVVAPLAAFSTWERHLEEMGRSVYITTDPVALTHERLKTERHDAVVLSYDRLHAFLETIEGYGFAGIAADELQRIRTPSSRRSRALRGLAGAVPIRIGLSGTPLSNRIEDVLAPGAFLAPSEWKPRASAAQLADLYPGDPIGAVTEHLHTLMVRRRMLDTGVKLPDKHTRRVNVELSRDQLRALRELEEEAKAAKAAGELGGRMHVFARLQKMRQIMSCPAMAGLYSPNPKVLAAGELVEQFAAVGRKAVVFCAHRRTWTELGQMFDELGIGWTGIWGSSSVADRAQAEKDFHNRDDIQVFIGTIASCAESLTLSPTATAIIFNDYSYSPSDLSQAEARAYRMNTTEEVDVIYLHADVPGGGLDDRFVEILNIKKELFARVVDGDETWSDPAKLAPSLDDLVYLLTGTRDAPETKSGAKRKRNRNVEQEALDFDWTSDEDPAGLDTGGEPDDEFYSE